MSTAKVKRKFGIASEQEILDAKVTDVYFERTHQILEAKGISKNGVIAWFPLETKCVVMPSLFPGSQQQQILSEVVLR